MPEQMGFEVVGDSQDTGSGLIFDRNGLAEVMEAAAEGKMDVLLIVNFSCLGRTLRNNGFHPGTGSAWYRTLLPLEGEIKFIQLRKCIVVWHYENGIRRYRT